MDTPSATTAAAAMATTLKLVETNETVQSRDATLSLLERTSLVAVLSLFSVTGTIGNAIAFYVFSVLKAQKLTSTIFILALAGTDFITCLITIPFTITVELVDFELKVDFFCKFYHFLITTTVPFSAFVMAVIAVDRYLCICHPFLHWMTQRRAKIIIAMLALFIFCVGGIICVHYSIYEEHPAPPSLFDDLGAASNASYDASATSNSSGGLTSGRIGEAMGMGPGGGVGVVGGGGGDSNTLISSSFSSSVTEGVALPVGVLVVNETARGQSQDTIFMKGQCNIRKDTIDRTFFYVLQRVYSGFFLVSCVVVLVLYSLIYHSVVTQRRKKLKIRSANCCGFLWDPPGVANGEPTEVTAALELSQVNGDNTKIGPDEFTTVGGGGDETTMSSRSTNGSSRAPPSRGRIERMRMANIKTALMLFVVTLVFILSFLPAWLIALNIIKAPVMVFYMYFIYNVANPFIYAFMNQNFRIELKKMFRCKK